MHQNIQMSKVVEANHAYLFGIYRHNVTSLAQAAYIPGAEGGPVCNYMSPNFDS